MKSIISYPERGPWGQSTWRGNMSGFVMKELIEHFNPNIVIDVCEGSGTSGDVCRELGVTYTSRCNSVEEFLEKSYVMLLNQREATKHGGIYATLIGDHRKKGIGFHSYQSDFIQMMPKEELLSVTIKLQHNVLSDSRQYSGMFIPIAHEYLLIWKRGVKTLFQITWDSALDSKRKIVQTWRSAIRIALMYLGGKAALKDIYRQVEDIAGDLIKNNQYYKAKIRQTLQKHFTNVERGVWGVF